MTSPHVHPIFAELLLRAITELWNELGRPDPFPVVEAGAGDGTLARDLLRLAGERGLPVVYTAVERSPGARERLAQLPCRVAERLGELGELERAVVFANELLDNLPFRRVRATDRGLVEIRVGTVDGGFVGVEAPPDADLLSLSPSLRPGTEATVPVGALELADEVATVLRSGYLLLIDYGSAGSASAGEVHGYRGHRVLTNVLDEPGEADITAGVDFGSVVRRVKERGFVPFGLATQEHALLALGFGDWTEIQRERQARMMAGGAGKDAIRVWEGRSRASLLVDPAGLGRLRWLLVASPGLTAPAWAGGPRKTRPIARSTDTNGRA